MTAVDRMRRRRAWLGSPTRSATIGVAAGLFILLCVLPVLYMLIVSVTGADDRFSLVNYRGLLTDGRRPELLLNSVLLGVGASLTATLIGAPLGVLMARAELPGKSFLRLALVVPAVIPPYVLALAWIYLVGPTGLASRAFGSDPSSGWTYSLIGAAIVLGVNFFPLSMLATEASARRVDGRLEEAALLITSRWRVLRRITWPLIAPSIVATALVIFVLSISEFGVPGLLRVRVFTTEVFTAFSALYDYGAATALAIPLIAAALIVGTAAQLVIGERLLTTSRSLHQGLQLIPESRRGPILFVVLLCIAIVTLLPIMALAHEAGEIGRIINAAAASRTAIGNSLWMAVIAASVITMLGVLLGYGRARARSRSRGLVDMVMIVVFAVPSTVTGIGLIGLWNRPALAIYGTQAMVVIGYLARFVPVATLILAACVRQVPVSYEEAAEMSGAGWWRIFTRIILPQIRIGILAAWVVAFIFVFGELGTTLLVAPPGESTLPVRIYTLIANTSPSKVAALALMQVCVVLIPLALLGLFAREKVIKQKAREVTDNG